MTALFLYGSLRHDPLLEVVLGNETLPENQPASLQDHCVYWAKDAGYPCLLPAAGLTAQGVVLPNPTEQMQARMDFYEACFDYEVHRVTLTDGQEALIYLPPQVIEAGPQWSLADWQTVWGPISVEAAREVMAAFGREVPKEVGKRFGVIRARAASKLRAQSAPSTNRFSTTDVTIIAQNRAYDHFFALDDVRLTHRRFDGDVSPEIERAIFVMVDSVTVLPYDPVLDRVLLIEQFRVGPLIRGDTSPWSVEPIAGRVDAGETPEMAAHRESLEEAGLTALELELIGEYYPSPGAITEYLYSYIGITDLSKVTAGLGGVAAEGEDIQRHILSFDAFMERVTSGAGANGPLLLSAYWLAQNRDRLRAQAVGGA
ncbi:NUDIX domain-containing protein [Falsihalocynthiibacter sp. S25ZX9]|uniref:NUDIX domain-containing protein n=1 Tax=Falsihalocynthiibacter sp. S25ZX9 TaxID=3240870 RepID=UPI00350F59D1